MRLYKFTDERFGLENIKKRRLKITTIDSINDPFEWNGLALNDIVLREFFKKTVRELASQVGLLCFSRRRDNPVQWAHYANWHQGICLAFDLPEHSVSPVLYRRDRIKLPLDFIAQSGEDREREIRNILVTKFSHWKYEHESRGFVHLNDAIKENGKYFVEFSENMVLKEVFIGANSSISRRDLADAVGELKGVNAKKMRPAFGSFRIVEQRKRSLWV